MPRGLNLFKTEYERADYDLEKWRKSCRWITKRDTAVLDDYDGAGKFWGRSGLLLPWHERAQVHAHGMG